MHKLRISLAGFIGNDEGGAVVEYALVISLVVIGLVLALGGSTGPLQATFSTVYLRVAACLAPGATTC